MLEQTYEHWVAIRKVQIALEAEAIKRDNAFLRNIINRLKFAPFRTEIAFSRAIRFTPDAECEPDDTATIRFLERLELDYFRQRVALSSDSGALVNGSAVAFSSQPGA